MIVELETFSPTYTAADVAVDTESDLRDLFKRLTSSQSATVSFGPPPTPSDDADVILGYSNGSCTITARRGSEYYQLVADVNTDGHVELNLGGQPTPIPRRWILSVPAAFNAIHAYVVTGTFDNDLHWEH